MLLTNYVFFCVCFLAERIGAEEAETMENKVELGEVVGFIGIHFMGKI